MEVSGNQLKRVSEERWGKRRQEAFLAALAATGNLRIACKAVGISYEAVRKRRRKDAYLDAACNAAIEACRARAPEFLASAMAATFDPDSLPDTDANPLPKVSIDQAIKIAQLNRPAGAQSQPEIEPYDVEEVRQRLEQKMRKLGLIEDKDQLAAGWSEIDGHWIPPQWGEIVAVRLAAGAAEPELTRCCPHCQESVFLSFDREARSGGADEQQDE